MFPRQRTPEELAELQAEYEKERDRERPMEAARQRRYRANHKAERRIGATLMRLKSCRARRATGRPDTWHSGSIENAIQKLAEQLSEFLTADEFEALRVALAGRTGTAVHSDGEYVYLKDTSRTR
jgi:hypothetical protein